MNESREPTAKGVFCEELLDAIHGERDGQEQFVLVLEAYDAIAAATREECARELEEMAEALRINAAHSPDAYADWYADWINRWQGITTAVAKLRAKKP